MTRAPHAKADPAGDSATVLRRIGILVLMIGLPLAAFAARTGPVYAFAIGIALLAAAALFDRDRRPVREALADISGGPAFVAGAVVVGWAVLSLVWSPAGRPAGSAAFGIAAILGLGLAGYLALPDRMRSANLYPVSIGAALAAFAGIALVAGAGGEEPAAVARRLDRGLAILVLYAWPAIGWLRSRGRDGEAIGLALVVAAAAAFGPSTVPAFALAAGAVCYLATQIRARAAGLLGLGLALLIVGAPALLAAFGLAPSGGVPGWTDRLAPWRSALLDEPLRLLTGHGFGSLRAGIPAAAAAPAPIGAPLLALWYELGIVGAVGSAVALAAASWRAAARFGPLLPAVAAAVATASVLALAGIDGGALWWPAALAAIALILVATQRGQFRTRRPRALGLGRTRPA